MVQSVLFFILGFLTAAFLAVLVGPAVWRRAVALTRKRIEASAPLTLSEIQADKDRIRASFAMAARRLEMEIKALKEKGAGHLAEIGRAGEDLKKLTQERDALAQTLSAERTGTEGLQAALDERGGQVRTLADKLAEAERLLAERADELENLGRLYEEASFSSSGRQIELVSRESEIEKLTNDISVLRAQRKEADKRHQELVAESKAAAETLKSERKKVSDLDKKLERLIATLADREEKLDRRESELVRLRQKLKEGSGETASTRPTQLRAAPAGEGAASVSQAMRNGEADIDKAISRLNADRERLEERLTALARENKRLKTSLAAIAVPGDGASAETPSDGELREQMSDLAAEVVHLAAMLDGPDSPIAKVLEAPDGANGHDAGRSLADRVRALQKAASPE